MHCTGALVNNGCEFGGSADDTQRTTGKLGCASAGVGGLQHRNTEMFKQMAGIVREGNLQLG